MLPEPITPEIVIEHHGEAMTTSLAIAEGVQMDHASVIKLVRKYAEDIGSFGEIGFEIRLNPHGKPTEIAWLNEQQATFLLTLMRNSEIVVGFKKALVKAFFALRDRFRAERAAPGPFLTGNPAHAADQLVSADRIFRGILRSGRSAGLPLPQALRRANEIARERTGVDMLSELDYEPPAPTPITLLPAAHVDPVGAHEFCDRWLSGDLDLPVTPCRSDDFFAAYVHWRTACGALVASATRVMTEIYRRPDVLRRRSLRVVAGRQLGMSSFVAPISAQYPPPGLTQAEWYGRCDQEFAKALDRWREPSA